MNSLLSSLARDAFDRLTIDDKTKGDSNNDSNGSHNNNGRQTVVPIRAFPMSAPDAGISLVGADGQEIVWIDRLTDLPEALAALISGELARREFTPDIKKIRRVSSFSCPSTWTIETDRGETEFLLKGEESIRRLSPESVLIADNHGIEYRIQNINLLDKNSRKLLDRFL